MKIKQRVTKTTPSGIKEPSKERKAEDKTDPSLNSITPKTKPFEKAVTPILFVSEKIVIKPEKKQDHLEYSHEHYPLIKKLKCPSK